MKNLTESVFAATLALAIAGNAQAQELQKEERPEVTQYRNEVRSNVQAALDPIGLKVMPYRSTHVRGVNIGVPLLDSVSVAGGEARMSMQLGVNIQRYRFHREIASIVSPKTDHSIGLSMKITY